MTLSGPGEDFEGHLASVDLISLGVIGDMSNSEVISGAGKTEDGKYGLHVHSFTILASVWLQLRQLTL